MNDNSQNLSRRRFMAVSSAVIATPLLINLAESVPQANGAGKKAAKKYKIIIRR
jgi:hypothetical protein